MTDHTRLTVTGSTRRVDVVVPGDEPIGAVLPQLIALLDEPEGTVARPLTLVRPDGEQIDIAQSPQQQGLLDGTALRLVRLDAAPPPPAVIDVTDAAADAHDAHAGRWDERARLAVGGTAIAAATAVAGFAVPLGAGGRLGALAGALAVLLAAAIGFGLARMPRLALAFAAAAAGLALPIGWDAAALAAGAGLLSSASLVGVSAALLSVWIAVGLGAGVALRRRGALAGAVLGAALSGLLLIELSFGMSAATSAAVAGAVAAVLTGLLPWIALSTAGLTGLDQRVADGEAVPRGRVTASVGEAYSALGWSVAATAAALAVTGAALVATQKPWAGLLALALALIAALRTRAFPLRVQALALWAAVAVIALDAVPWLLAVVSTPWIAVGVALAASLVVAVGMLVRPRPHQRARLRSLGNVVETVAVVALLPLVLGVFDVYADLLALFGGGA